MKKFLLPLFLMLATAVGFTSCSDDDDDKSASVTISVNGEAVDNNGSVAINKGTVASEEGTEGTDDIVTLSIMSTDNKNITSVQVSVNNDFESNVDVVDSEGNVLNSDYKLANPATSKDIKFTGVYGTYTVKIVTESGSKTYKFTTTPAGNNKAYSAGIRYMSNKQTIVFDANNKKSFIGLTYNVTTSAGATLNNFGSAQLYTINADTYNDMQGLQSNFMYKIQDYQFGKIENLNTDTYKYLVYKSGSKYYLMQITSIDAANKTLTAEVQY